jgi:hypothetical protein
METPAEVSREPAPLRVGVDLGSDPATCYYHRERINILVYDSATVDDIRAAQNFLHTLVASRGA